MNSSTTRSVRRFAYALLLIMLAGCASNEKARDLQDTVRAYESAIRWGNFRGAINFIAPEDRPDSRQLNFELQRLENIRVTGVLPLHQAPQADPDTVVQIVEIRYANRHTAVERTVQDRQVWRYDPDEETWWLISGLPDITRR